ncbi:MAG: hypothetical protein ABSF44_13480 [Candidatus Bathyarchaeia archaeon]|jgi:hypothetical protein
MEMVKRIKKEKARSLKSTNRRIETGRKMPIVNDEWDSGEVHSLEDRIMSFLNNKGNMHLSFNLLDIMNGLGYRVTSDPLSIRRNLEVRKALEILVKDMKIEKKTIKEIIDEETYYRSL